ncbi:MAG: hypothetical protein RMJ67_07330 [Elusimicrobiota bacterium]|nr:hypothetical protein [Endomicrobiia bacterium]MDW8166304.1 hypothetical protein [Elusimicrobiota bacterium]
MKKLISILAILTLSLSFAITQQETQAELDEVDVDVDVVVEAGDVSVEPITQEEIVNIISDKLSKNKKLTEEQKQKILEMVKQKLQDKEVPEIQLCIEICKQAEIKWRKGCNLETCKKDIENVEKKIKNEMEDAEKRLEKTFRKRKHSREQLQQAKEVLQKLVENGVPVQHALDIVSSIPSQKEDIDFNSELKIKLKEKFQKGEPIIPEVLPQEIQNKLQLMISELQQIQFQHQTSSDLKNQ